MRSIILITAIALLAACRDGERQVQANDSDKTKPTTNYFKVDSATAGRISGKVSFEGRKPVRKAINVKEEEPDCAGSSPLLAEDTIVNADNTLANVFVYVSAGLEGKTFAPPEGPARFDQKGCA